MKDMLMGNLSVVLHSWVNMGTRRSLAIIHSPAGCYSLCAQLLMRPFWQAARFRPDTRRGADPSSRNDLYFYQPSMVGLTDMTDTFGDD